MYGFITSATLEYISSLEDGERLLQELYAELGEDPKNNFYTKYSDDYTQSVVLAASKVTGQSPEDIIAGMGHVQIKNFAAQGYTPLVKALGRTFYECLKHIDALHRNLVNSYPDMLAPSFRPEPPNESGMVMLHYYSSRPGLWPYAMNLLQQVAKLVYNVDMRFEHYQKKHEGKDHDIFKLYLSPNAFGSEVDQVAREHARSHAKLGANTELFDALFPWHFQIDRSMRVVSMGSSLQKRFKDLLMENVFFHDIVKLSQPNLPKKTFDVFLQFDRDAFVVIVRDEQYHAKKNEKHMRKLRKRAAEHGWSDDDDELLQRTVSCSSLEGDAFIQQAVDYLYIRGEIIYVSKNDTILFAGIPLFSRPEEMYLRGLSLSDVPVHSNGREMLFSTAHQAATINIAAELEQTSSDLTKAQKEVEKEKQHVQELLHSILPQQVAQSLSNGIIPEAERFQVVTILFSDVPSFSRIVGSVKPTTVMQFLNDLFSRFDSLCDKYGLYKVETIGDSYMVASGIPEFIPDHADRMAKMAVEMTQSAKEVVSPIDGAPIKIRIGMHSGPIMAGVIGKTRPRYCLFGDTVNVASRMTSTSCAGRIHYSASTMSELHANKSKVKWFRRGDISVKGKGMMETYFLTGYETVVDDLVPSEEDLDVTMFANKSPRISKRPSKHLEPMQQKQSSLDINFVMQLLAQMHTQTRQMIQSIHNSQSSISQDHSQPPSCAIYPPTGFFDVRVIISSDSIETVVNNFSKPKGSRISLMNLMCAFQGTSTQQKQHMLTGVADTNTVADLIDTLASCEDIQLYSSDSATNIRVYADGYHSQRLVEDAFLRQLVDMGILSVTSQENTHLSLVTIYCLQIS